MKAWMGSARIRDDIANDAVIHAIPRFPEQKKNTSVIYDDYQLWQKYRNGILRKYLWLPRFKLRKYALEHGTLPEKISDALSEDEITHSFHNGVLKLEYCVNPRYAKNYPEGTVVCGKDNNPRRFPHLHLLQYKREKTECRYYSKFDLDEPEPPLPGKGALK